MADQKISALTAGTAAPIATDLFVTVEDMATTPVTKSKAWSVLEAKMTTLYAGTASGVTNGDTHDHLGGDGGTIAYTSLSGTPTMTAAGLALLDDATAADQLTTLGAATATLTFTNKRITSRVGTVTSAATITPTADLSDLYTITAQNGAGTFVAPSGTPTDGQKLIVRIANNGTGCALTWSADYRACGVALPGTSTASKTSYIGFIYNAAGTVWDLVAANEEA